jgi:hypothetical protein
MPQSSGGGWGFDQPEPHMIRARIRLTLPASTRDVARAILVGTEERAAPVDLLLYAWLAGIETVCWPLRIARDRALRDVLTMSLPLGFNSSPQA